MVIRHDVPNNESIGRSLNFNAQIVSFLLNEAEFSYRNQSRLHDQYGDQIINVGSNKLPKGLITLESVFNPDDQARDRGMKLAKNKDYHMLVLVVNGRMLNIGYAMKLSKKFLFINVKNLMMYFLGHMMI